MGKSSRTQPAALCCALQIRDNEFLQRENLLLEAYLAKVDFAKIGITLEDDSAKASAGQAALTTLVGRSPERAVRTRSSAPRGLHDGAQAVRVCTAPPRAPQVKKGTKKKNKIEVQKAAFNKLNDDEKNDIVSQEIELLQAEIEQVRGRAPLADGTRSTEGRRATPVLAPVLQRPAPRRSSRRPATRTLTTSAR